MQVWPDPGKAIVTNREPNGEDCYWSRGNGWVVVALVRTLELLPADSPHRAEYTAMLATMAEALRKVQRADGFLGYVQGTGKEPKDGQPVTYTSKPDFTDYGLGAFLLAGTEVIKLASGK